MQAITVKYLPPTNTKGSRLKAICSRGSVTVSFRYDLEDYEREAFAASELVKKFQREDVKKYGSVCGWGGIYTVGTDHKGDYIFVSTPTADLNDMYTFYLGDRQHE